MTSLTKVHACCAVSVSLLSLVALYNSQIYAAVGFILVFLSRRGYARRQSPISKENISDSLEEDIADEMDFYDESFSTPSQLSLDLDMSQLYNSLVDHLGIPASELPSPPSSVLPIDSYHPIERPSAPPPPPPIPRKSSRRLTASAPSTPYIQSTPTPYLSMKSKSFCVSSVEELGIPPLPLPTSRSSSRSSSISSLRDSSASSIRSSSSMSTLSSAHSSAATSISAAAPLPSPLEPFPTLSCSISVPHFQKTSLVAPDGRRLRHKSSPREADLRSLRIKESEACLQRAYEAQTDAYLEGTMFAPRPSWRAARGRARIRESIPE